LLLLLVAQGCANGLIYTHVIVPLDRDMDGTPIRRSHGKRDAKELNVNFVRIAWGSAGIVDAARQHGLVQIDYVDLETRSILGIWTQRYALVYGRRADEAPDLR